MKKCLVVGIILLFIGMSVVPSTGTIIKQSYEQVSSGDTLYVGGSGPGNYSSIQAAIDDSNIGDTVFVYDDSSPYYENLLMDKSINLIGENKETTIIDGCFDMEVIWVEATGITISGFTLRNADIGLFGNMKSCIVSDNIFSCHQAGIALLKSSNNQIFNNEIISGYEAGIAFLHSSYRNVVFDNIIRNTHVGVFLAGSCNFNKISSNTIKQCPTYGIWIYESFLNFVNKNNFIDVVGELLG
jgi:parallel beta-helix repeat protein